MRSITAAQFALLLKEARVKTRLQQELRFNLGQAHDLTEREFIAVSDQSHSKGVLVLDVRERLYLTAYELARTASGSHTGRTKPITCDLCFTWQDGSNAGRISFLRASDQHIVTVLCCADLACSDHVRGKTLASQLSRTQLREDLTNDQRSERLVSKLDALVKLLNLSTLSV
jgi:hypothetical protein